MVRKNVENTLSHAMAIVFENPSKCLIFYHQLILLFSLRIRVHLKFVGFSPRTNFLTRF